MGKLLAPVLLATVARLLAHELLVEMQDRRGTSGRFCWNASPRDRSKARNATKDDRVLFLQAILEDASCLWCSMILLDSNCYVLVWQRTWILSGARDYARVDDGLIVAVAAMVQS